MALHTHSGHLAQPAPPSAPLHTMMATTFLCSTKALMTLSCSLVPWISYSARYTQLDGQVVTPGGARSTRESMEADRPRDMLFLIDCMEALATHGGDSRFAGRVDTSRVEVVMSSGG